MFVTEEELHWHFDNNHSAITLGIQEPESGGELEYVKDIGRDNFEAIEDILKGREHKMKMGTYKVKEGALSFFRGGNSMHRVRPVVGNRLRLVAALQYHDTENAVDDAAKTERIYGIPQEDYMGAKKHIHFAKASTVGEKIHVS